MRAVAVITPATEPPEVHIEHNGERLIFNLSRFGRRSFENFDVFEYISKYWSDLPLPIQDKIFNIYKEVSIFYDDKHIRYELDQFIGIKCKELLELHDLVAIDDWISFRSDIIIPASFDKEYVEDIDSNNSRDKTYTRKDYKGLLALSLAIRCLIPLWGTYINLIKQDAGNEYKEQYAFKLIYDTPIMGSNPMSRLKHYVQALTHDKHTPDNVLKGISSEDFVYWLLSLIVVKRLCVANLQTEQDGLNVITFIYKFIIQRIQGRDNSFENSYKEKIYDVKGPGGQENRISTLEKYKIKTTISPGEVTEIECSARDIYSIAHKLTSRMTPEFLDIWLQSSKTLLDYPINDPQMIMLAWVLETVLPHQGLMYIGKERIVELLAAAQAALWLRGHPYLSLFLGSYSIVLENEMLVSPVDSKMRLSKEQTEEIERYYPFTRPVSSRRRTEIKPTNIVLDQIDSFTDSVAMYSWRMSAHTNFIETVFQSGSRKFLIRPDIKTYLAALVIQLGKRDWI